ncbi:MAG: hypothetical protein ACRD0U_01025 [Acidimicrobiales bacterium]
MAIELSDEGPTEPEGAPDLDRKETSANGDRSGTPDRPGAASRWRSWLVPFIAGAGVALLVAIYILGRSGDDPDAKVEQPALVTFEDPEGGFTIQYPETWTKRGERDGDIRLLLSAGGQNSAWVRSFPPFEVAVTPDNLADLMAFTDAIIITPDVTVLNQQAITLHGMPAFYYLYTFRDQNTGMEGVHAHYFVFQGRRAVALVFQAIPTEDFSRLAGDFDRVAESLVLMALPDETSTTG